MEKLLDSIIIGQLGPGEDLQPEIRELLTRIVPRIIQAGIVYKKDGSYRFGNEEVCEKYAIRRVINNLSSTLKSNEGYQVGLVDTTRETLERQHETISSQIRGLMPSEIEDQKKNKLAVDIADVFLTSWLIVDSLSNESGWGDVWIQR